MEHLIVVRQTERPIGRSDLMITHTRTYDENPVIPWGPWLYSWISSAPLLWQVYASSYMTKEGDEIPRFYQYTLKLARGKERCVIHIKDGISPKIIDRLVNHLLLSCCDTINNSEISYEAYPRFLVWKTSPDDKNGVQITNDGNLRRALMDYISCLTTKEMYD